MRPRQTPRTAIALFAALNLVAPAQTAVIQEFTGLFPVRVERIAAPTSTAEVSRLVRENSGPISIGGGRYSMGGQTATDGALQIDMRHMDRVRLFSPTDRTITVEAGMTWRKIQNFIDPHGLSLKIMQSYANFTVGGALSVNCHGRYVNQGPIIRSVRAIEVVLADGRIVHATPKSNADVFYGAIGGYGGVGVITAATLELEPNDPLERTAKLMPIAEYPSFFASEIKGSTTAVFHNGDIYPPDYDRVAAITFSKTTRPVTVSDHHQPAGSNWKTRWLQWWLSERTYAKRLRESSVDPIRLKARPVVWRNYEASYDVAQLEPYSRRKSTYVLQEYFVPIERFGEFTPRMAEIFRRHRVNVLNVSIRHAEKDPGSIMAWARRESFAFVVWYKQGTSAAERGAVEVWTRELISVAIESGGTYYLPYQIVATPAQFHAAYPRAKEFFALKKRLDPTYKFRNKLWDTYFPPPPAAAAATDAAIRARLQSLKKWSRPEEQTFLTLPEWSIVYAADELAAKTARDLPSRFPYFSAIWQFWQVQAAMRRATEGVYPSNPGYRLMIAVIGTSFTVEYALKGLYEISVGRLFEIISLHSDPGRRGSADLAAGVVARDYAAFMHDRPWYEFPFKSALMNYRRASAEAPWTLRKTERRVSTTIELAAKAAYGKVIGIATGSAYDAEDMTIKAWVRTGTGNLEKVYPGIKIIERLDGNSALISLPRYQKFQGAVSALTRAGVRFVEIAGNTSILVTVLAPSDWDGARLWGGSLGSWPLLAETGRSRFAVAVPVSRLHEALADWDAQGLITEHLYDY